MRYTGPSPAVLRVVKARNEGLCLRCSRIAGVQTHHRRPRGRGGSFSDPVTNRPDNCVWVCFLCHEDIESNRSSAYAAGWLVRHGIDEPYQIPLTDIYGAVFFLTETGDVIPLARAGDPVF